MDSNIISLISVVVTAGVSIWSSWNARKERESADRLKKEFDIEIVKVKNELETQEKLKEKQIELISQMVPYAIEMSQANHENRYKFLALAYRLESASTYNSYARDSASNLVNALTKNYENKDKILWLYLIEDCANSVNAGKYPEYDQETAPQNGRSEKPRKIARVAEAIRAGWKVFRQSLS